MIEPSKHCLRCHVEKPLTAFQKDKRGRRNVCIQCRSNSEKLLKRLRKEYLEEHGGVLPTVCDCCGQQAKRLVLDHCHDKEVARGWLCDRCNIAIGNLGDTLEGVMNAVKYLEKYDK